MTSDETARPRSHLGYDIRHQDGIVMRRKEDSSELASGPKKCNRIEVDEREKRNLRRVSTSCAFWWGLRSILRDGALRHRNIARLG